MKNDTPRKIPARMTLSAGNAESVKVMEPSDKGRRTFYMLAYTGAPVNAGMFGTIIVDLDGMDMGGKKKPILLEHDRSRIVGYSDAIERDGSNIVMRGTISQKTEAGKQVAELSDEGFPWQSSIGFEIQKIEEVKAGKTIEVNGADFAGPGLVVRKSYLRESSFCPLGADPATSAVVLADGDGTFVEIETKETPMEITPAEFAAKFPDAVNAWTTEGYNKAKAELSKPATAGELRAAFPDKEDSGFIVDQLGENATLSAAKSAYADVLVKRVAELAAKNADLEKKLAEATTGQGAVGFSGAAAVTDPATQPDASNPKALAEWEWDNKKPEGFSTKERYVAIRVAQLNGQFRMVAPAAQK